MPEVPPQLLARLLRYDDKTGELFWRERSPDLFIDAKYPLERVAKAWNRQWAGKEAFTATSAKGEKKVKIFDRPYRAHRVVWALVTGAWPASEIDHIDQNPTNNVFSNLRDVTCKENNRNRRRPKTNTSGRIGVHWTEDGSVWRAQIVVDGVKHNLGRFSDFEAACRARDRAERLFGFHPNHGADK